jgi:hypothetical protein
MILSDLLQSKTNTIDESNNNQTYSSANESNISSLQRRNEHSHDPPSQRDSNVHYKSQNDGTATQAFIQHIAEQFDRTQRFLADANTTLKC